MVSLSNLIFLCILLLLINRIFSQQSYDKSTCTSVSQVLGPNYLCHSKEFQCDTYIVYRAQTKYNSLSSISSLFNVSLFDLLHFNNMIEADSTNLTLGREIIIPITCFCHGNISQAIFMYNFSHSGSFTDVACGVYEGLVKVQSLIKEGPDDSMIKVPIRCTCPDENDKSNDVNFLVTYPIIENDHMDLIARKFGVSEEMIWKYNRLESFATIFPLTTLLIPTKCVPVVNWNVDSQYEVPPKSPAIPLRKVTSGTKSVNLISYALLGVVVLVAVVFMIVACGICITIRRKCHPGSFQSLSASSARSSVSSNFSPDFLDGVSKLKHSLINYSLEELKIATEDFNEASVIGTAVYRGRIGGSYVAIEQMNSVEAARHVIYILTRINHLNVVKLEGCCYGTIPYLVYEFAENGSLRDCLSNAKMAKQLTWTKRIQIAFDLAVALNYIHYCTKPAYIHRNINSRNVLVTMDWRAKISGFRLAKPLLCSDEKDEINCNESVIVGRKGYLAPEYLIYGLASLKVDVYAFGVVLLELLSAKEVTTEGKLLKDSVKFLVDAGLEGSSECLEKFKEFMDPVLEGNYPLADAVCLALLAKACVEQDPHQRPTMNDVLKALSRIV